MRAWRTHIETNEFEQSLSDFLETKDYDQAEDALFSIICAAFLAGWRAAGGTQPEPLDNMIYLLHK